VCESYGVRLRPAVGVLVVPYFRLLKTIYVHLLEYYLNKLQNSWFNDKDNLLGNISGTPINTIHSITLD